MIRIEIASPADINALARVEIESKLQSFSEHMDAIAMSAKEQAVGLTQVNTAVNEMDQVTQKNAAMVEEANAASATLADESDKLQAAISAFRLRPASGTPRKASIARTQRAQSLSTATVRKNALRLHGSAAVAEEWEEL